jgi:hypothetical protein
MEALAAPAEPRRGVALTIIVTSLVGLALTMIVGFPMLEVAAGVIAVCVLSVVYRTLLEWRSLVLLMVLVILFIPIKRYTMPGSLPFELEPYRVVVAFVAAAWVTSLLIDPRVRLRRTGFERPLILLAFAVVGSILVNDQRITSLGVEAKVLKEVTFFASFFLVTYLIASICRSRGNVDFLVKTLVGGGCVVAILAIFESRTGTNVFDRLGSLPLLIPTQEIEIQTRGGRFRAFGPAQHPIALGAALAMLFPLAVYLAASLRQRRWWFAAALLMLGALAPVSRTAVLMLVVSIVTFICLRPKEVKKAWPVIIPAVVIIHFALPSTLGTLKASFFPKEGLIADQSQSVGSRGQGRIADLGPAFAEYRERPFLGQGFGTRVVDGDNPNAQILDNQWLKTLLETGLVGALAVVWLLATVVRRLARSARSEDQRHSWLAAALAASIAAYAIGMFTFDAFSFVQVTFILFILLGFASAELTREPFGARARSLPLGVRALATPPALAMPVERRPDG